MNNKISSPRILSLLAILLFSAVTASAQQETRPDRQKQEFAGANGQRPNLLRELGLSREQIRQIRRINAERKPLEMEAAKRFQAAKADLDAAIYAENVNDDEVQIRLKAFQTAQAELFRLRFTNELAVRKLLTPEQLIAFRQLRQRFEEARKNAGDRLQDRRSRLPLRQLKQSARPIANQ